MINMLFIFLWSGNVRFGGRKKMKWFFVWIFVVGDEMVLELMIWWDDGDGGCGYMSCLVVEIVVWDVGFSVG